MRVDGRGRLEDGRFVPEAYLLKGEIFVRYLNTEMVYFVIVETQDFVSLGLP